MTTKGQMKPISWQGEFHGVTGRGKGHVSDTALGRDGARGHEARLKAREKEGGPLLSE